MTSTEKNSAINQDMPLTTDHLDHCVSKTAIVVTIVMGAANS